MKKNVVLSLVLHLTVLVVLWWAWPGKAVKAPLRLAVHTGMASRPGVVSKDLPGPPTKTPTVAAPPLSPAPPPSAAMTQPSGTPTGPVPLPTAGGSSGGSSGNGEPIIDALTSGPVSEKPSLLGYPSPGYPREARRKGWEGVVEIEVEVSASGIWTSARVLRSSGHGILDDAALEALRQARYEPATRNGVAEAGVIDAVVRFRLD